jgi:pimeloyl-ACP methyl ester carboxylesterase
MGWDEFFLRAGHPVYVIDQAGRGRSAIDPSRINAVKLGQDTGDHLPMINAASHEGAWTLFRLGDAYGKTYPGQQFPVEAEAEFWKQMVADFAPSLPTPNPTVPGVSELAKRLKGTVLVSHSQSGIYPFQAAEMSTDGIAGIVAIEPANCPKSTDNMAPFVKFPILVLFGDYLDKSAIWSLKLKECTAFMTAANAAGGKVEVVALPDVGFHGNSHMLMEDRNSLDVAKWLVKWIDKKIG